MLLTKKSEYAMLALVLIAKSDTPQNADSLSAQLNISKSFLAKILQKLAKYNILQSYKGINGGFLLNKEPGNLTILELITISEDRLPSVFECSTDGQLCSASVSGSCTLFPVLTNLQFKINDFLKDLTLKDIM
ncbi:MAG: Rrf2 family transcriptional regulator [Arcobacteraceae bacterium]|nr:Rrf2 family transcriptional regulator [Arcobacteraceae bacterium]